jgi:hypothetical protein
VSVAEPHNAGSPELETWWLTTCAVCGSEELDRIEGTADQICLDCGSVMTREGIGRMIEADRGSLEAPAGPLDLLR